MHRYWLIKHLITRINSSGLHWRGALLPFNAGPSFHAPSFLFPLLPCLLFSLAFTPYGLPFWQNLTQWSTPAAPATLPLPGLFLLETQASRTPVWRQPTNRQLLSLFSLWICFLASFVHSRNGAFKAVSRRSIFQLLGKQST